MIRALLLTTAFFASVSATIEGFGTGDQMSLEHLKGHFENKIDIDKHSSPSELKFYYFQLGDTNKDHALDGIELFNMITEHGHVENPSKRDVEMIEVQVDQTLADMDQDGDGLITFSEYSQKFK